MAAAALVVSILALIASGASALYTRSQAHAQAEATAIERDRRRAERAPEFDLEIEDINSDYAHFRLWVTLMSNEPMDYVAVELSDHCIFRFPEGINGVRNPQLAESYEGPIRPGGRACWRIELPDTADSDQPILVRSRAGADDWTQRRIVRIPSTNIGVF